MGLFDSNPASSKNKTVVLIASASVFVGTKEATFDNLSIIIKIVLYFSSLLWGKDIMKFIAMLSNGLFCIGKGFNKSASF